MGEEERVKAHQALEQSLAAIQGGIKTGQSSFLEAFHASQMHEATRAKEVTHLLEEIRQTTDLGEPLQQLIEKQREISEQQIAALEKQALHLEQVIQKKLAEPVSERMTEESAEIQEVLHEHTDILKHLLHGAKGQVSVGEDSILLTKLKKILKNP